jgi:hypothetical protein
MIQFDLIIQGNWKGTEIGDLFQVIGYVPGNDNSRDLLMSETFSNDEQFPQSWTGESSGDLESNTPCNVYSVNLVFEHYERQLALEFTAKLQSSGATWGIDNFILRFNKTGPESSGMIAKNRKFLKI